MPIRFYQQWYDLFNNFSANAVVFNGITYPTAEHAYQAAKCLNQEGKEEIRLAKSPIVAKSICNVKYKDVKDPDWDNKKLIAMENILRLKLSQHEDVSAALKMSGNEVIEEDFKTDAYWGIGADGMGQNELGKLWMKIRKDISI